MPSSSSSSSSSASTPTATITNTSTTSSSRSLLHRLRSKTSSLTFRTPRKPLTDFHIELQDPHRVYSPNDIVLGSVCVTAERPLALTHLTVSLLGRVDVYTDGGARKRNKGDWDDGDFEPTTPYGRTNLCRDEIVLCGEGRLEPGVYKFKFELEFCKLPGIGGVSLPTSLDFEKGSISYFVSATITRPTSVSPTSTCSTKISLMETIDIGHLVIPKPHLIELEPISRLHSKQHNTKKKKKKSQQQRPVSPITNASSSPATSEINLGDTTNDHMSTKAPVTARVELLTAGALRGECIRTKISIKHTKKIKSMNGVILTLMRQTRFDPVGDMDIRSLKKSNHLPPMSTFRKDLAQTICPLIIDPNTLTAVVRATVRVPEDVFPTIKYVPGGCVDFRYFVEVVLDLGGKLTGRDDIFSAVIPGFPRPLGESIETDFSKAGGGSTGLSVEGGVMIETDRIRRREKSVVVCRFEVTVGSVDTVGRKGRMGKQPTPPRPVKRELSVTSIAHGPSILKPPIPTLPETPQGVNAPNYDPRWRPPPPPDTHMDEKTRARLAQEALLPSAPPGFGVSASSSCPSSSSSSSLRFQLDRHNSEVDKAERERRRLQALESAPPMEIEMQLLRPSAPPLDELPEYSR